MGQGIRRLRVGPVDVVFGEKLAEVQAEITPELAVAKPASEDAELTEVLDMVAVSDPASAVVLAFARVEHRLQALLGEPGSLVPLRADAAARLASGLGLITEETLSAVEGLAALRDLATHGSGGEISTRRAQEFVALAATIFYILQKTPTLSQQRSGLSDEQVALPK